MLTRSASPCPWVKANCVPRPLATTSALQSNDWNKFAVGYGYNLSKRTQLYTTYARVSNKAGQIKTVANNGLGFTGVTILGGKTATGFEAGIRHSF
jgi:predicted porin